MQGGITNGCYTTDVMGGGVVASSEVANFQVGIYVFMKKLGIHISLQVLYSLETLELIST